MFSVTALPDSVRNARVVITCGVSGSGKTYLGRLLEAMGFVRVSVDAIAWRLYGGDFSHLPWEKQQELFRVARAESDRHLDRLLKDGRRVVVDATMCHRPRRDTVRAICREHDIEPLLVYLPASFETLLRRLSGRRGKGPDDIIIPEEQLRGFFNGFEPPESDESFIELR